MCRLTSFKNLAVAVAEGHAAGVGTAEHNVPAVGDLAHSGLLIENIQNAVARGEGALQPGAEIRQRDDRPKLLMSAYNADKRTVKPDGTRHEQAACQHQHTGVQQQDDGPGHGLCRAAGLLQAALLPGQRVGALVDLRQPMRAVVGCRLSRTPRRLSSTKPFSAPNSARKLSPDLREPLAAATGLPMPMTA